VAASKGAKPRRLAVPSENPSEPAVSRQGNRLAYAVRKSHTGIWRVDLRDPGRKPGTPFKLFSSTRNDLTPAYSPDGKRIAFSSNRSGNLGIWVSSSDGSNAVQLTSSGQEYAWQPRWSPDGRSIVFSGEVRGNPDIYVISADGGAPRRLTTDPAIDKWPCWSRDGQSIYFVSNRSGSFQIWKMPANDGEAVQITPNKESRDLPQESPDGEFLYYQKGDSYPAQCSVCKMPVGGGNETKVLDSVYCNAGWAILEQGIYFFTNPDEKGRTEIRFYEFATGKTRKIQTIERDVTVLLAVSPDGRTILYPQSDQSGSDLMLVENFR
jgi:Tol biopolymer transport system component